MFEAQEIITALPRIRCQKDFPFSKHTTVGIGGTASLALFPKNESELESTLLFLRDNHIPHVFLGQGANVLVSDRGYNGAVVCTSDLKKIVRMSEGRVYAECGVKAEQLVRFTLDHALDGAAFLAGIPASVGGLVFMNAGADRIYVESVIEEVRTFGKNGFTAIPVSECGFSYKKSIFQTNGDCIVGCTFRFKAGNATEIAAKIRRRRFARGRLPKGRSMGCIFQNPPSVSAGELIERSGWKGYTLGGASVSCEHANFIINTGNATSRDFHTLISLIQKDVYAKTGVLLHEEIRYIGE